MVWKANQPPSHPIAKQEPCPCRPPDFRSPRFYTETAKALAAINGVGLYLDGLQRASFGAVRALRNNPNVSMPNHWYLLRYEIAALVGTVVFMVMVGVVVWYSRRQRAAG